MRVQQRGFTVIELVAVIVLIGLLGAGATLFIGDSVRIYTDNARRTELTQQARFVIEKISREVRNALPGSVRVNDNGSTYCLEFMPIIAGSSYTSSVAGIALTSVDAVPHPDLLNEVNSGDVLTIFAVDNDSVYNPLTTALATINSVAAASPVIRITLDATHTFALDSPQNRFFIVRGHVSYCAQEGVLTRYSNYTSGAAQPLPPTDGNGYTVAENIRLNDSGAVVPFLYEPGVLERTGVVHLDFRFRDNDAMAEWVRFSHEIFIRNTQ